SDAMQNFVQPGPDLEKLVGLIAQSITLLHAQRGDDALRCLEEALCIAPDFPPALVKRGNVLQALSRHLEAIADFDRCLALKSDMPHVRELRDAAVAAALASYRPAPDVDAGNIDALNDMGNLLLRVNRHDDALACYEQILAFAPDNAMALFNRGNVLQQNACYGAALSSYAAALAGRPGLPEVLIEQAHCRLAMGEFQAGWPLFEARWDTEQLRGAKLKTDAPLWCGEPLQDDADTDAVLLLWAEQGVGDTIQFARYLPLVALRAKNVMVRVPASLQTVIAASVNAPTLHVVDEREPLPLHTVHCPLMSLPLMFGTNLQSIPDDIPYLKTPDANTALWRARLGERGKPRIGLVWAGGQRRLNNPTRDMPLAQLRPLLQHDAEWISLQKDLSGADLQTLATMPSIRCVGNELADFADTAAVIEQLDLVISVDSAVAHLAGALGKPVWLMLRKSGEWRWMQGRSDSPWYPLHRLFRQQAHGEWGDVVQAIVRQLASFALPNQG
ncbi:MAG: tetratricopeptide repeat protein, partial [Burkholderiales bacterium]